MGNSFRKRVKKCCCCCCCCCDEEEEDIQTAEQGRKNGGKRKKQGDKTFLLDSQSIASNISSTRNDQASAPLLDTGYKDRHSQDEDQESCTKRAKNIQQDSDTVIGEPPGKNFLNQEQTQKIKPNPSVPSTSSKRNQQAEKDVVDSQSRKKLKLPEESTPQEKQYEDRTDELSLKQEQIEEEKPIAPVPATRVTTEPQEQIYANISRTDPDQLFRRDDEKRKPEVTKRMELIKKASDAEKEVQKDEAIYENSKVIQKKRDITPEISEGTETRQEVIYENTQQIQKNRDISPQIPEGSNQYSPDDISQEPEISKTSLEEISKSNCLKEFLKSIGLDQKKHYKLLSTDAIYTLEELQQTINDENKVTKFDSKLRGIDKDCLNEAVKHEDILKQLEIIEYFPERITLQMVMSKASGKLHKLSDVPWYFLSKILMIDYRCRDDLLPKPESGESMESEDTVDDIFAQFTEEQDQSLGPHPTDILIAIFQCCSNLLRQVLCEKMYVCKLALPLLLPPFIDRNNKFLLWSLRNINIGYKTSNGEFCENSLVNCPTPVVSCMRIGKPSMSKSKFLNEILNGQTHNTFFHKDCSNGMLDRKVSNGLLEFAVYIPSKRNSRNQLSEVVTLVNLRGDGLEHESSRSFLMKSSNVILVMVDISDLQQDIISSLKAITSSQKDLILMLTKKSSTKFDAECKQIIRNCVKEIENENFSSSNLILGFTGNGDKNMKELLDEVVSKIRKFLEKKTEKYVLVQLKDLEISLNMIVDEKSTVCSSSQFASQKLLEKVKSFNIETARGELLPLQCKLWQEWAKINKIEHRLLNKGTETEGCAEKKMDIRREQRGRFEQPECFIRSFINLINEEENNRQYILKWLKLCLDELSRKKIPVLQEKYGKKWEQICQTDDITFVESLRRELNELEVRIADASFGIEHLFREIGQVYEAYKESECEGSQINQQDINSLPRLMAQLLLQGYPLEIMDGDASHVPLTWVKAVLTELANIIGAEKRLFALSVLGAQSSGKSTLLNTMFGLQFPVAAGRCTRGVYAQLVPLCKEDPNTKYDYILVLDTEGLKAPELGKVKFNHDNEIATLVTGLGDVTLINVKGENVSDMQDVLQIVVHAILKMRLVNKSLKMQPTCIFLHQNVSVPDAAQKMKKGQQNFMEIMNKVTRTTGEMENATHISNLNQVIEFDIDKHIWYFSDLWEGDPPMAPANPGYSDKIQKLKKCVLTDIMQQRSSPLTISELCNRIEDLWNGILHENFVFSLKNNLESRAYIALETKLLDITKDLKRLSSEWISKRQNINNSSGKDTQNPMEKLVDTCEKDLAEEFRKGKRKLELYFEMSEDKEMIDQWRKTIMSKLNDTYEEISTETKGKLNLNILETDL